MCIHVKVRDAALFFIMYADDTVLFSETEKGLQEMLYCLEQYKSKWKIKLNVENPKIIVLRKGGKLKKNISWMYDNNSIDVVDICNYFGITLNFKGNFHKTKNVLASQSKKKSLIKL